MGKAGRALVLGVAGLVLVACTSSVGTRGLEGRTFVSTETRGIDLPDGTRVRLTFGDGEVTARADCNTMVGRASWHDGVLRVTRLLTTEMWCGDLAQAQDEWVADLLTSEPALVLTGDTLVVGDGVLGAIFTQRTGTDDAKH